VLLLIASGALFATAYVVYSAFLGGIDGLTPLPEAFWPMATADTGSSPPPPAENPADRKLQMAFGEGCPELQRSVKLELRNRGIVLAVDDFTPMPEPDGRMKLEPFSIALFGKPHEPGSTPEINTIRSKRAFLTFDKPVANVAELGSRKIVEAELQDDIEVVNNRRTLQRDDDLSMHTKGPMWYREDMHRIWTHEEVELTDIQSKPEPTKVTARGMDIYLTAEKVGGKPPETPAKPKPQTVSGVDRVALRSTVRMNLFVDSRSGFLAPNKGPEKPPAAAPAGPPAAPEKSKVVITTAGPFYYDVNTDHARFEIPHRASRYPENVQVQREHEQGKLDQLFCDYLDLQFRHKQAAPGTPAPTAPAAQGEDRSVNLEIQNAHATGTHVTLTSDSEGLEAVGNDLFYDAVTKQTTLKGVPEMVAMKDGNEIYAQELLLESKEQKETQEATAKGPGRVRMLDRSNGQRNLQASWTDLLVYKKEGNLDTLTLTGNAAFMDREHNQEMRADRLKVWLEPADPKGAAAPAAPRPAPAAGASADPQQRMRPKHVEARGHVIADAPELHIKEPTENLDVWFRDAPVRTELPSAVPDRFSLLTPAPPAGDERVAGKPAGASPSNLLTPPTPVPGPGPAPASSKPAVTTTGPTIGRPGAPASALAPEKTKQPIDLCAQSVVVNVLRVGDKNELDHLTCEGAVHVHQEPASAEDKGMDIRGETLQLTHHDDGSILVVTGNLAHVQLDKIAILGPEVNIDQRANKAWVNGIGAMQMLTDTNFEGAKLAQPTELTIHWKEAMLFNGNNAEFRGGVQAEQLNSRLLCQEMQVAFDRPISLKEGDKSGTKPKVDKLLCDKDVQIEDVNRVNGQLQGYKRLVAPVVALDNADEVATAPGPGEVRILQLGEAGNTLPGAQGPGAPRPPAGRPAAGRGPAAPPKQELKLTHVRFAERMQANNKQRSAIFYGNVEAVHVPADRPDIKIDVDHPPPGCIYLRCAKLNVFSRLLADGKTKSQELEAYRNVLVQAQEFWGLADVVKYDEAEDRVIFEAGEGGMATLYRVKVAGGDQEKITGKKIYYWRKTNDFKVDDAHGLNVAN
jgi:lipopolysaccharide export system protein LptA